MPKNSKSTAHDQSCGTLPRQFDLEPLELKSWKATHSATAVPEVEMERFKLSSHVSCSMGETVSGGFLSYIPAGRNVENMGYVPRGRLEGVAVSATFSSGFKLLLNEESGCDSLDR